MSKAKALRQRVHQKFGGRCAYCGSVIEYKAMQVDHYLPQCREKFYARRCKKDVHAEENLMPACRRCNHYKRARTPKQFRELMASLHERLEAIYILKVAVDFGMASIKPFDGKFYFEKHTAQNDPVTNNRQQEQIASTQR
jgi:5-methylcytosine-specific restriction endonuclease McrA